MQASSRSLPPHVPWSPGHQSHSFFRSYRANLPTSLRRVIFQPKVACLRYLMRLSVRSSTPTCRLFMGPHSMQTYHSRLALGINPSRDVSWLRSVECAALLSSGLAARLYRYSRGWNPNLKGSVFAASVAFAACLESPHPLPCNVAMETSSSSAFVFTQNISYYPNDLYSRGVQVHSRTLFHRRSTAAYPELVCSGRP